MYLLYSFSSRMESAIARPHHAEISFAVPHIQTARLSDDMVEGAGQEGAQRTFTGAVFPETGAAVIVLGL